MQNQQPRVLADQIDEGQRVEIRVLRRLDAEGEVAQHRRDMEGGSSDIQYPA